MLKNNSLNFTPVSNVFIEKYMPKARGEFIKVYLLMLKYNNLIINMYSMYYLG